MISMVKSESFGALENAYNFCFGTMYVEEKNAELAKEQIRTRFFEHKKEAVETINSKGLDNVKLLKLVDAIRAGKETCSILAEKPCEKVVNEALAEIVNDIGYEEMLEMYNSFEIPYSPSAVDEKALKEIIFRTALFVEVRINTYNILAMYGVYDNWCRTDKVAKEAYKLFGAISQCYGDAISNALLANPEFASSGNKMPSKPYEIAHLSDVATKYGVEEKNMKMYMIVYWMLDLIDGRCEWFWNED